MTEPSKTFNDPAAEKALLGLALSTAGRKMLDDLELDAVDFLDPRHEAIWDLIIHLYDEGKPTDALTVHNELHRVVPGLRDGISRLLPDLVADAPRSPMAHHYARIVANAAVLRRLDIAAGQIRQLAGAGGDGQDIAELALNQIAACQKATAEIRMVGEEIDATINELEQPSTAVPTPWPDLNYLIKGWRPGALYVVAARPGVGKSIVGLQAAVDLAKHGPVPFFSLEMPRREVHIRLLAQVAGVHLGRLNGTDDSDNRLSPQDWERISKARGTIADLNLAIEDRFSITVNEIRTYARALARQAPLAGIVVDYLQLVSAPRGDKRPRHELVAEISRSLKSLAKELGCPVLALSQLNRNSEQRADKKPSMADIRESGAVEQDADVILLLHADENDPSLMDVIVEKNRHGAQGLVQLIREGQYARAKARPWSPSGAAA